MHSEATKKFSYRLNMANRLCSSGYIAIPGTPEREYYYYVPETVDAASPLIVSVHGISRNAAEHMVRLRNLLDPLNAIVVAPLFTKKNYGRYQQLLDKKSGTRSDLALLDIVDDIRHRLSLALPRFHLFGYSGGAQFAHRFLLYHTSQVESAVLCSAGWYTMLEEETRFPYGVRPDTGPQGMSIHPDWLQVPVHICVGTEDIRQDSSLNQRSRINAAQGSNRVERAITWHDSLRAAHLHCHGDDSRVRISLLTGVDHDYSSTMDALCRDGRLIEHFALCQKQAGSER